MRRKIVLRRCAVLLNVTLPNGTSFAARYERLSKKNLPDNIRVTNKQTIGPRKRRTRKKKVRFALANTPTQERARRIRKKYKKLRGVQTGRGLEENLAKLGLNMGSKAINFVFGKKLIGEGIKQIPNIYKYETSKIKNKNVERALNSDIANIVVDETQNRAKNSLNNLFGGV